MPIGGQDCLPIDTMSYNGCDVAQETWRASVEDALLYIAEMVSGPGGEVYVTLFERVERDFEALTRHEAAIGRARRLASATRTLAA